jgi:hypothetical protein
MMHSVVPVLIVDCLPLSGYRISIFVMIMHFKVLVTMFMWRLLSGYKVSVVLIFMRMMKMHVRIFQKGPLEQACRNAPKLSKLN